jgi:CO/xanthine dehydrogenase FAD-binding subunit
MSELAYVRAHTLGEAIALLNEPGVRSRVLAGGTDLVNQHRAGHATYDRVVDVAHVPELRVIEVNGRLTIGAAVTHTEIVESALLQELAPLLVRACGHIGSPQIRNIATIGGNVINAAACADTLPALVCLGARAVITTPGGELHVPVADLVTGVNNTALPSGGLVRAFTLDQPPANCRVSLQRLGRSIRVVPGAAFARFRRITPVEELLYGQQPTPELVASAGRCMTDQFLAESGSRWSAPYKRRTIAALTQRALTEVFDL